MSHIYSYAFSNLDDVSSFCHRHDSMKNSCRFRGVLNKTPLLRLTLGQSYKIISLESMSRCSLRPRTSIVFTKRHYTT
jgi:hypothetical protein